MHTTALRGDDYVHVRPFFTSRTTAGAAREVMLRFLTLDVAT